MPPCGLPREMAEASVQHEPKHDAPIASEQQFLLQSWFSPAFPLGAFAYSQGLESLVEDQRIETAKDLGAWLTDLIRFGAVRNETVFLAMAYSDPDDPSIPELALAMQPTAERRAEVMALGAAFSRTVSALSGLPDHATVYPVAVGHAARALGLPLDAVATGYLQSVLSNLVSASQRLLSIGQTEAQALLASTAPDCAKLARLAHGLTHDDLGTSGLISDIASMRHETQAVRLFQT